MYKKPICLILFGFVLSLTFSNISSGSEPNLVGWWKFDETSGATAYESTGYYNPAWPDCPPAQGPNTLDGTLNGGATFTTAGYRNGAVQLDGTDGYVSFNICNFGDLINMDLEECTLSIWVYWDDDGTTMWQRFIDFGNSTNNYIYVTPYGSLGLHTALAVSGIWRECGTGAGNTLPPNGWHHVAVTVSDADNEIILYLDGNPVASNTNAIYGVDDLGRIGNNWLGRSQYGSPTPDPFFSGILDDFKIFSRTLSRAEIRQTADPEKASMPNPDDESTIGQVSLNLEWQAGIYADKHDVYFSSSFDDVNNANRSDPLGALVSQDQETTSYPVSGLTSGETYYWRIDEVNETDIWRGRVWSFLVQPEKAYNPSPPDDTNYVDPNADLSWSAGYKALTHDIYFGTTYPPPFIKNQVGTTYEPGTMSFDTPYYWRIDERNSDATVTTGDDWEFRTGPEQTEDPHLVGWWKFDDMTGTRAIDSSGYYNHGTLHDGPQWVVDGKFDGAIQFDGDNDYVSLPVGEVISTLDECTIAVWVDFNDGDAWQRIFSFGTGTQNFMYLSPEETTGVMYSAIMADGGTESTLMSYNGLPTGWHHVAMVLEAGNWALYLDSEEFGLNFSPLWVPSDLGVTTHNWLGRSEWPNDPYFNGSMDDFRIYDYAMTQAQVKDIVTPLEAWLPKPANNATGVYRYPTLSWESGKFVADINGHELYYSTDFNDVNDRVGDPCVVTDPCYVIPGPNAPYDSLEVVYWVVDEVNESHDDLIWPGDIWSFTIRDASLVDDFELYTATGKSQPPPEDSLKSAWVDGNYAFVFSTQTPGTSGSLVQLNTDPYDGEPSDALYTPDDNDISQSGAQSMKFYYDNDGTVTWEVDLYDGYPEDLYTYTPSPDTYLSEAYAAVDDAAADSGLDSLDMLRDWSIYNVIGLSFYGEPNNTTNNAGLYISLEDGDGTLVTIAHPDSTQLIEPWWHDWYIKLSDFTDKNAGLALTDIAKIYIGFGDKDSPASGGSGVVFFDDIQLFTGVCIPGSVIGDLDDNCTVNNGDLEIFTYNFPGEMPILPTPIINLNASGLSLGPLSSWANTGSLGGAFTDVNSSDPNKPVVEMVDDKKCVTFDATDMLIWDQNAPSTITGDSDYTVIYEVYNPSIATEEWILTWAMRGGPERSSAGVGYGTNADWGCIIHWDPPGDMGFDLGVPIAKQWHTIATTYDGTTNAVIVDGLVHGLEDKELLVHADQPVTLGAGYEEPADANDAYILSTYVPTYDLSFTGSIASIKVYGEAIPPGDLAILTASLAGLPKAEADFKPDSKIDFGDLAVMGYIWMEEPVLFGEDY